MMESGMARLPTSKLREITMAKNGKAVEGRVGSAGMKLNVAGKITEHGVNILKFEVPPELDKTIPTGINFVDDTLGGEGFTPSTMMLFTGGPGAGKTTLMVQLADSMTGQGCIVLYSGTEEAVLQLRKVTKRLEIKNGFVVDDNVLVDRCPDPNAKDERETLLDHARALRKKFPTKQLVIVVDSLQSHDDGYYTSGHINSMSSLRVVEKLADFCKSEESGYAIGIVIGQVNKSGEFSGKQAIKHAIDCHLELWIDKSPKSETFGKRLMTMSKNRFGVTGITHILGMTKKGIVEEGQISYDHG